MPSSVPDPRPPYQPRATLFRVLAVLWIFPSLGALWIIASDCARWFLASSFLDGLRAVTFEQWIALPVLALHPVFVQLASHYRKTEPFKPVAQEPESESESSRGN